MSRTRSVITANIRGNPEQPYGPVRRRIRQAIRLAGAEGVTFLQECDPANKTTSRLARYRVSYQTLVIAEARLVHKEIHGLGTESPIVIDTAVWKIDKRYVRFVHGGLRKVSPHRVIVVLWATHRETGERFVFANEHPVSKGHYPRGTRGIPYLAWRILKLQTYDGARKAEAKKARRAGRHYVEGGDMNDGTPTPVPGQIRLAHHGLDNLVVVPAPGYIAKLGNTIHKAATRWMDHPIVGRKFLVRKASK